MKNITGITQHKGMLEYIWGMIELLMRLMKEQPSDDMILERLDEKVLSPVSHVDLAAT